MSWEVVTAIAGAVTAVVGAVAAVTGRLSNLIAKVRDRRNERERRLRRARSPSQSRSVFLDAADSALDALKALGVALQAGEFARPASSAEFQRLEQLAGRAHDDVAFMRKAATNLHDRFAAREARVANAALQAAAAVQYALDALARVARPGTDASADVVEESTGLARGHIADADAAVSQVLALGAALTVVASHTAAPIGDPNRPAEAPPDYPPSTPSPATAGLVLRETRTVSRDGSHTLTTEYFDARVAAQRLRQPPDPSDIA